MDLTADFFSLFQLPRAFRLDAVDLDSRYREIQGQVHPDRFAHTGDSERRLSMQWATRANEAYQTLWPGTMSRQRTIPPCRLIF